MPVRPPPYGQSATLVSKRFHGPDDDQDNSGWNTEDHQSGPAPGGRFGFQNRRPPDDDQGERGQADSEVDDRPQHSPSPKRLLTASVFSVLGFEPSASPSSFQKTDYASRGNTCPPQKGEPDPHARWVRNAEVDHLQGPQHGTSAQRPQAPHTLAVEPHALLDKRRLYGTLLIVRTR